MATVQWRPEVTQTVRLKRLPAEEKLPLISSAEDTHAPAWAWLHSLDALWAMRSKAGAWE